MPPRNRHREAKRPFPAGAPIGYIAPAPSSASSAGAGQLTDEDGESVIRTWMRPSGNRVSIVWAPSEGGRRRPAVRFEVSRVSGGGSDLKLPLSELLVFRAGIDDAIDRALREGFDAFDAVPPKGGR